MIRGSRNRKVGWLKRWVRSHENCTPLCVYSLVQCSEGKRLVNHQKWLQSSVFWKFWLRHVLLVRQRHALFWHLNFQKMSENGIFFKFDFSTELFYTPFLQSTLHYTTARPTTLYTTFYYTTFHYSTLNNTTTSTTERHPTKLTTQNGKRVHHTTLHHTTLHQNPFHQYIQ